MLTYTQRRKCRESINKKVGPIELLLIPHRIEKRCITYAKTDEAKQRLVGLVTTIAQEDMARLHVRAYPRPVYDRKHNYREKTLGEWFMEKVKFW